MPFSTQGKRSPWSSVKDVFPTATVLFTLSSDELRWDWLGGQEFGSLHRTKMGDGGCPQKSAGARKGSLSANEPVVCSLFKPSLWASVD